MNYEELKKEITSTKFISTYVTVFILLFIFTSIIKIVGSLPMLIILSFILTYYLNKMGDNKLTKISTFINEKKS
tara:strand:- start:185 stop:406 length:222 start_codon:yes stop_codon:yes gene_type:complete